MVLMRPTTWHWGRHRGGHCHAPRRNSWRLDLLQEKCTSEEACRAHSRGGSWVADRFLTGSRASEPDLCYAGDITGIV
jgi:hypothetical protein